MLKLPWDRAIDEDHLAAHWFGRMLSALYFSTFMIRASFAIMLISFPIYIISLKSYFLFGLVLASSPLFELLTVLGLGAYIDKHGRKNVLLLGLLVGSIALFALLLTKDPVPLFIINAFHGMAAAAILVASLALIADYAPPKERGRIMGAFDFTNIFGWITGFGVGGVLIDVFKGNIGMTFAIAGILGLIAWGWAVINVQEPHRAAHLSSEISFRLIASVIKQRSVILLIAPWFIIYLLISTMLTFTSKAGTQELGLSGLELGLILGGGGGIFLVTQVVYGHLSDIYGRTRIMIVGTVGIVGIMLTVGGVFLTAPAVVAPAARSMYSVNADDDPASEFLLQSDYGVYIVDENGTVLKELGPPEGGFGSVQPVTGTGKIELVVSTTNEAVQVVSIDNGGVTWVMPVLEPRAVRVADLDEDGSPEILFADDQGIHVAGPQVPPGLPTPPAVGQGEHVLDLQWGAPSGTTYALIDTASGPVLRVAGTSTNLSVMLPAGYTSLVPSSGFFGPPSASGPEGALAVNLSSGAIEDYYSFAAGWQPLWLQIPERLVPPNFILKTTLIAYSPKGGGTVIFQQGQSGPPSPVLVELPSGFRLVSWSPDPGLNSTAVFVGFAENGTLVRAELDFSQAVPASAVLSSGEVLVKRETAQSTFAKLTSPFIAVPLGIFALMAGAFGPAALAGLTDVSQTDKRGTTMGLYSVVISTSMIVGPVVTGFLVDNYGGFGVMLFLVLSAVAMAIFMALRALDVRRAGGEHKMREAVGSDTPLQELLKPADDPPKSTEESEK